MIPKPAIPTGTLKGKELENFFLASIYYHLAVYNETFAAYDPKELFDHWRLLYRSIDELINIPMEYKDRANIDAFLNINFNFLQSANAAALKAVLALIETHFGPAARKRLYDLSLMTSAVHSAFRQQGNYYYISSEYEIDTLNNARLFYQSRRIYFLTTLLLIPRISTGRKKTPYLDTLNQLFYPLISCTAAITNAYFNLLKNEALTDFEMQSDGTLIKGNFDEYEHLEMFFAEPERLSLLDQLELRNEIIEMPDQKPLPAKQLFAYVEIDNTLSLFRSAFAKYNVQESEEYKQLSFLVDQLRDFCRDNYEITLSEDRFTLITVYLVNIQPLLTLSTDDYYAAVNAVAPFTTFNGTAYSTVVLLVRFVYQILSRSLTKNRTFQINSGFVFEDRISAMLKEHGFTLTGIVRIEQKEFDIITIKDAWVYNFQCKNNILGIAKVSRDYKKMGRLNRRLVRYYEKSLVKEEKREALIREKTGITQVKHFVISRFPVMTRNKRIINFASLEIWLDQQHYLQ